LPIKRSLFHQHIRLQRFIQWPIITIRLSYGDATPRRYRGHDLDFLRPRDVIGHVTAYYLLF